MMAFPGMLVGAAKKANMNVPDNPDDYDQEQFPHFDVFCKVQLGRRMVPGEHWDNAEIIASISKEEIKTITLEGILAKGLIFST